MAGMSVIQEDNPNITKDQILRVLPSKHLAKYVTDDLVNILNSENNEELRRIYKDNFLSFTSVMSEGKFSLTAYANAIKFCTHRLMGDTNILAYSKVFPDRYQNMVDNGTSAKYIASFASSYSKTGIVIKIMEQSLVPTHILNASLYQEAINTQAELMRSARSETVRQKAAESLMVNLKAPEAAKIELDISYNNDTIEELRATTRALAKQQLKLIEGNHLNAKDIAESKIIEAEILE